MNVAAMLLVALLAPPATDAGAQLSAELARISRLAGDFTQQTTDADGYSDGPGKGRFMLQRPAFLRWQTDEPWSQLLIGDGRNILLYDPDLEQMTVRAWDANPRSNPALVLLGGVDIAEHFAISREDDSWLLRPLDDSSWVVEMRLRFDDQGLPAQLRLEDRLGQVQSINFANMRVPEEPIDARHFQFQPPPGTAVSREQSLDSAPALP